MHSDVHRTCSVADRHMIVMSADHRTCSVADRQMLIMSADQLRLYTSQHLAVAVSYRGIL